MLPGFVCDNGRNIHVGDNFLANYRVTILDCREVYIGNNCVIGAGAVVTRDIPSDSVVVGVPARVIKTIESYV